MKTDTAPKSQTITKLSDYCPPAFDIQSVYLDFTLEPSKTLVRSKLIVARNVKNAALSSKKGKNWVLNGEDIDLKSVRINGKRLRKSEFILSKTTLTLKNLPDQFELEIETICNPKTNKSLMGLYVSGGRFCTQCEAEGFRRITYYPDRPDVLSVFTIRIEADQEKYPTLLSNGNCTDQGVLPDGRHFTVWHDPFPKPCYLFALVGGAFDNLNDTFTTMSGRTIELDIYVDTGNGDRAHYAMDALKRSMKWDETAFGREYDLDRFMIVAVRDFNFGAMENKGLNIFNSSLLLADEKSATDMNFELIESVIGHEYFHNWTGNRITCRDWFQLCLKEGFTVFRDQEFSADQRGAALQRIKDVKALRSRQFPEDAGPLAHPVRPNSYLKIDNFYTATIYEKGAELIRMLKTILGDDDFRKGCDTYFDTLDGTAATIEEFIQCFETATGQDLSHFLQWYSQAGTPNVTIKTDYNQDDKTYTIDLHQKTNPTAGQPNKKALPMPVKLGLIDQNGQNFGQRTIVLDTDHQQIQYVDIDHEPVLSAFRGFSAPVNIHAQKTTQQSALQMNADEDLFNKWEAGQALARDILIDLTNSIQNAHPPTLAKSADQFVGAMAKIASDAALDDGFKALALTLPSESDVLQAFCNRPQTKKSKQANLCDPIAVHLARNTLLSAIAQKSEAALLATYQTCSQPQSFAPDALGAGRRSLRNTCLSLLANHAPLQATKLAQNQFSAATNMTEEIGALAILVRMGGAAAESALAHFYEKWRTTPLVLDKWFAVNAGRTGKTALSTIVALSQHPDFKGANPNRVRALIGGFAMSNATAFHAHDGSGYRFFTDQVQKMDQVNPQVAARLLGVYGIWKKLDLHRQNLIKAELKSIIAAIPSANVFEIATKSLGDHAN